MKKNMLILIVVFLILAVAPFNCCASSFDIRTDVNYDNGTVSIECVTPATYGQRISVILYKLANTVEIDDILDKNDPEKSLPFDNLNSLVRARDIYADKNGEARISFTFGPDDSEGLYIVSVSGGGYLSDISKSSSLIYFENAETINNVTLPLISSAPIENLESIFDAKSMLIGIETGDETDYDNNKELINSLFINVRDVDFNGGFTKMSQVNECFDIIKLLRDLYSCNTASQYQTICEDNSITINLDKNDKDYKGSETEIYELFKNHMECVKPTSLTDIKDNFTKSVALNAINKSNTKNMSTPIEKYIDYLDINENDYKDACKKYGSIEVNKAFVEKNFTLYTQVKAAFDARLVDLYNPEETESENPPPSINNGSNSGGNSGGSVKIEKPLVTEVIEKEPDVFKAQFTDLDDTHWAFRSINSLCEIGVVDGFTDGSFRPNDNITREQFIKMIVTAFKWETDNVSDVPAFDDLTIEHWSNSYINTAKNKKVITGMGNNMFGVGSNISRQDAAVIIYRSAKVKSIILKEKRAEFADNAQISDYAIDAVGALVASDVINGMGNNLFCPEENLTRAQAAKIIYGLMLL